MRAMKWFCKLRKSVENCENILMGAKRNLSQKMVHNDQSKKCIVDLEEKPKEG